MWVLVSLVVRILSTHTPSVGTRPILSVGIFIERNTVKYNISSNEMVIEQQKVRKPYYTNNVGTL